MLYERKIRYLDYISNGERVQGGGFVKFELKNGGLQMELNVMGLYRTDSLEREVLIRGGGSEKTLGRIIISNGRGQYRQTCSSHNDIGGTGIGYGELQGIRIPLGAGREVSGSWDQRRGGGRENTPSPVREDVGSPRGMVTEDAAVGAHGGNGTDNPGKTGGDEEGRNEEGKTADEGMRIVPDIRNGKVTGSGADTPDGEGDGPIEQGGTWGAAEEGGKEAPDMGRRKASGGGGKNIFLNGRQESGGFGKEEMPEVGGRSGRDMQASSRATGGMPVQASGDIPNRTEMPYRASREAERQTAGEMPGRVSREAERQTAGEMPYRASRRGTGRMSGEMPGREQEAQPDGRARRVVWPDGGAREVPDRMAGGVPDGGNVREPGGERREASGAKGRNSSGKPVRLLDDKWQQLWAIYPHIRPFRDDREYLSIGPSDFVLFPSASYKMVNNSFLLHGYYNYNHLLLAKLEKKGETSFYIGVPGNYFEKEKQVAIMFGFESFECAEEPAQPGDFGYYMMRVGL